MWDLPGPGIKPVSPALADRFLSRKVLSLLSLPTVSLSLTHTDGLIYHILHTAYNLLSSDYLMMLFPSSLPRQADHRLL